MNTLLLLAMLTAAPATQAGTGTQASAKTARPAKPALDVSKLPFSADTIREVVASHMPQIQDCYEQTLAATDKPMRGRLRTFFKIDPYGIVKDAKVLKKGTTLKDPELHQCVVSVLQSMTFPKPPENRDYPVEYPFNLKPVR